MWEKWEEGDTITDDLTVVSWCDGDTAQIQTIIDENGLELEVEQKIISNKLQNWRKNKLLICV